MLNRYTVLLALLLALGGPAVGEAAISVVNGGAPSGGTTGVSLAYPASIVAGNLLVACVSNKYPTNGPSTPAGWTAPANNQGTGDAGDGPGDDVGATYATWFYKVADGTETGNLTVTVTSGNSSYGQIIQYTNATGNWSVAAAQGGDSTSGTAWSVTGNVDPGVEAGDIVIVCVSANTDAATFTVELITQAGVTYGAMTELSDNSNANGNDTRFVVSEHPATAGPSSAAPVYTATAAAASAGGVAFLRLREIPVVITPSQGFGWFFGGQ